MPRHNNGKDKVIFNIPADAEGTFIRRLNRFAREILIHGMNFYAHIHDLGQLEELLYFGNSVLLKSYRKVVGRKTEWELLAARLKDSWIFVNSKFHRIFAERIFKDPSISPFGEIDDMTPEIRVGNSRLDFLLRKNGKRIWVEVKGCTLIRNSKALFPDAPTSRGRRHVNELLNLKARRDDAALVILVFIPASCFAPNAATDSEFAQIFCDAVKAGIEVRPLLLAYDGNSIIFCGEIPLCIP
ncbi:MAG: DNA/RNA nuclease SfsA [Thermoplasmata archaeon]|nr:DNA/RNA nuclease SfsA [Thermoplasmata archaeon]